MLSKLLRTKNQFTKLQIMELQNNLFVKGLFLKQKICVTFLYEV